MAVDIYGNPVATDPVGPTTRSDNPAPVTAGPRPQAARGGRLFFAALIGVIGAVMAWLYAETAASDRTTRSWQEIPAKIEQVGLHRNLGRGTLEVVTDFEYVVGHTTYQGHRVTYGSSTSETEGFQLRVYDELSEHVRRGVPFHCYVDPNDPTMAILYRGPRSDLTVVQAAAVLIIGMPAPFFIVTILAGFAEFRRGWRFHKSQSAAFPREPWLWREDWSSGVLSASSKWPPILKIYWAAAWNLITVPLWSIVPGIARGDLFAWVGLALVVTGWLLAIVAALGLWHSWRTVVRLSWIPAEIGGQLIVRVETSATLDPSGHLWVTLRCVQILRKRKNLLETAVEKGRPSWVEQILWETSQARAASAPVGQFDAMAFDAEFEIPLGLPATKDADTNMNNRIVWLLRVSTSPDGKKHFGQFEIPVFTLPTELRPTPALTGG